VPEKSINPASLKFASFLALAGLLSGCATLPADSKVDAVEYRACLVVDGDLSTTGVIESSLYSLNQAVVTFGIQKTVVESSPLKFAREVDKLVLKPCDFITIVGAGFTELVKPVVEANPNINFLFISDEPANELLSANLSNLAIYGVDVYEAGLLAGHIAASITETRQLAVVCQNPRESEFFRGVEAGMKNFDQELGTTTTLNSRLLAVAPVDVYLPYRCQDELPEILEPAGNYKIVGFGRDVFLDPKLSDSKDFVAATIIPQAGPRLFEAIAADLESEFLGGIFGSVVALFGNGGLVISEEHALALPAGELEKLQILAEQYESSLQARK
jgi:hypothetical protein